ncbi:hypothetical protein [Proteiniphilum sp.]|uniref:hypothetical protein n=1 Tax=Proteiniphilum sp. TaxID=1926877 RepID=UPI00331B14C6
MKTFQIFCLIFFLTNCFGQEKIRDADYIKTLQNIYRDSVGTDWLNWVVVDAAPTRIYMQSWTDEQRETFFNDFDPDFLDMWSGAAMNRGDFYRMRGVAVNSPMECEYQESINPVMFYAEKLFGTNGIARKEDGTVAMRGFTETVSATCMCNLAPKWEEVVRQGVIRPGIFGNALYQDNIANPLYTWNQGFCGWCNYRFIRFMEERFTKKQLSEMHFDPETFNINKYIREKRLLLNTDFSMDGSQIYQEQELKNSSAEELLIDPILREYIRFQYITNIALVVDKANALKKVARQFELPTPVFYGNIPHISGLRASPTIMAAYVDVPWSEVSTELQPPFYAGRQAWSTLVYKVGRAMSNFERPVFTVQYHGGKHSPYGGNKKLPTALAAAEAHANGGVPVQTWIATEFNHLMGKKGWDKNFYEVNRVHAKFTGRNRVLFTDRTQVAHIGLVHSLTSTFWRQFQSFTVPRPHLNHFTAVARFLEEEHLPYEIIPFGHPDVFDDTPALARLNRYRSIIIPEADCISDVQAEAISNWVRNGGNLILWGINGVRDEEMNPRKKPVFSDLLNNTGSGTVRIVDKKMADLYALGVYILPTSKEKAKKWKYTFSMPSPDWFHTDFNDAGWASGNAPFGSKEIRGAVPNTEWTSSDIWLRREFDVQTNANLKTLIFDIIHLWDTDVYINGVLAANAKGRGRVFEGYQTLDLSPEAMAAVRIGCNVIALHCKNNPADIASGQIVDVGILSFEGNEKITGIMQLEKDILDTDLLPTVWTNVWKHGAGPMTTVTLVNYDLKANDDFVRPVRNFTIRFQSPDVNKLSKAYWFAPDYFGDDPPPPIELAITRDGNWINVQIPQLDLFGVVVFSAEQELPVRTNAAAARKAFNRIRIAQHCLEGAPVMDDAAETAVRQTLAKIQGNAAVEECSALSEEMQILADSLYAIQTTVTYRVMAEIEQSRQQTLNAEGVLRFDFGTRNAAKEWIAIEPNTIYTSMLGYGWTVNQDIVAVERSKPDALHSDFIRNINPINSSWPGKSKNRMYPFIDPPHRPGEFRIDLPNGKYRVTIISGDYSEMNPGGGTANEGRTASTYVEANGKLKLFGEMLRSGRFDNRAFETTVTDGKLILRFFGKNVGPLYHNSIEWLVNGVLIQTMDQTPTAAAQTSIKSGMFMKAASITNWHVLGPFADKDFQGMEIDFGPETNTDLFKTWQGKNGVVSWVPWTADSSEVARVPLDVLCNVSTEGLVAFAQTRVSCSVPTDALLHISMTQRGAVYVNGEKVYEDQLAVGLLPQEAQIPIRLNAGENTILVKSLHHWGDDWAIRTGLNDLRGQPLSNLKP